jgi:hypothetical protein
MDHSRKKIIGFFSLYAILMVSLIMSIMLSIDNSKSKSKTIEKTQKISAAFQEEVNKHEVQRKQRIEERKNSNHWQPSKEFAMIAVVSASILDIIIILLWARHENRKREVRKDVDRKWTDRKWFWNIIAMGIVQPKNNRIVLNWRNLFLFIIIMYILKTFLFNHIWEEAHANYVLSN